MKRTKMMWCVVATLLLALITGVTAVIAGGGHPWLPSVSNATPEGAVESADGWWCEYHGINHHYTWSQRETQITSPGGNVWFNLNITPDDGGKTLILQTASIAGGPNVDTEVWLYSQDGSLIGYDDQSGDGDFSMMGVYIPKGITTILWIRVAYYWNDAPTKPFTLNTVFLRPMMPMAAKLSRGDGQAAPVLQPQAAEREPSRAAVNLSAVPALKIQIIEPVATGDDFALVQIAPIGGDTLNRMRK